MSYPVYYVPAGDVLPIFFDTFDGGTGASASLTGLAVTDIEIYKDGGVTQRASDAGYTLLDTDGIDFDGITGINGFSIDTGDNTDAGFYTVGAWFHVVVSSITVDSQTVNFVAAAFRLMSAETSAGVPQARASAIADGAITASTIATGAIDADAIADNAIDAGAIAANAITSAKIATGAITNATFAAGAIDAAAIAANAIGASELAADAVTEIQAGLSTLTSGDVTTAVLSALDTDITATPTAGSINDVLNDLDARLPASGTLSTLTAAAVNAEVVDALATDTYAEPGQGAPAATATLAAKINYLYKAWRNKSTQTADTYTLFADDATTTDQKATISDDTTTFTRGEVGTGA
jgi:hypothetical protein